MQHALIVEDVPETGEWLSHTLTQAFGNIHTTQAETCQQARDILQHAYMSSPDRSYTFFLNKSGFFFCHSLSA